MVEAGRYHPGPKPWLEHSQPEQHVQISVQGFEHLHRWRVHNISGQPDLVSDHPYSRKNSVFLCSGGISCVSVHALLPLVLLKLLDYYISSKVSVKAIRF